MTVRGQPSVHLDIPRGQSLRHDGRMTVWTGTMTPDERREVEGLLTHFGLEVTVHGVDPHEGDGERTALHVPPPDRVGQLPTLACPTCAWLDVLPGGGFACGVTAWHPAAVEAFDTGRAAEDRIACPCRGYGPAQARRDTMTT
ncbi:MAG: hypothetical protein EBT79_12130 [Actinobacteria bacterium]|nr:hypothetical protein [Actinomycetota bacterium]